MRLAISVFVSIVGVVHAYAADTYQIIPISISPEPGDASVYEAIVANILTGDIVSCEAVGQYYPGPKVRRLTCVKAKLISGVLPSGPAVVTGNWNTTRYPAGIWKVNQTNGDVTFCAASTATGVIALKLACVVKSLPP